MDGPHHKPPSPPQSGHDDLTRLASGELVPAQLQGDENRERRERLYAAAADLARPEHAELRRALTPMLQHQALAVKRELNGDEPGRQFNRKAGLDPNAMGYVFVLRQMYHDTVGRQTRKLQARFPRADDAMTEDAALAAFTAVVLNPNADLARDDGNSLLSTAMQRRMLDQLRAARRQSAIHLDQPEGEGLALSLSVSATNPADACSQNDEMDALKRVAAQLPRKEQEIVKLLIESEGDIGPAELARREDIPRGTASRHMHEARTHFRRLAATDPDTRDTMQAFRRKNERRRHPDDDNSPPR